MKCLTPYLVELVEDTLKQPDWYRWRLPKSFPDGITLQPGTKLEQTRALKRALSAIFASDAGRRLEMTKYVVGVWGGVKRNAEATLHRYTFLEPDELITQQKDRGISSWSKVLHLREPQSFYIYDARTAIVLNLVQLEHSLDSPVAFPIPDTQNRLLKPTRRKLRALAKRQNWLAPSSGMYVEYISLLRTVASAAGVEPELAEMALFSRADAKAAAWLAR